MKEAPLAWTDHLSRQQLNGTASTNEEEQVRPLTNTNEAEQAA
jgi:hypothetical protein